MTLEQFNALLDGSGYLGTGSGNLYEYAGIVDGKYYFQDINSQTENSWLFLTEYQLLNNPYFNYQKRSDV